MAPGVARRRMSAPAAREERETDIATCVVVPAPCALRVINLQQTETEALRRQSERVCGCGEKQDSWQDNDLKIQNVPFSQPDSLENVHRFRHRQGKL
jgi:hypothetical protein